MIFRNKKELVARAHSVIILIQSVASISQWIHLLGDQLSVDCGLSVLLALSSCLITCAWFALLSASFGIISVLRVTWFVL